MNPTPNTNSIMAIVIIPNGIKNIAASTFPIFVIIIKVVVPSRIELELYRLSSDCFEPIKLRDLWLTHRDSNPN